MVNKILLASVRTNRIESTTSEQTREGNNIKVDETKHIMEDSDTAVLDKPEKVIGDHITVVPKPKLSEGKPNVNIKETREFNNK